MKRKTVSPKKCEEFAYHLNADLEWLKDPKNQKLIRRMIRAAARHMKKKYASAIKALGKS